MYILDNLLHGKLGYFGFIHYFSRGRIDNYNPFNETEFLKIKEVNTFSYYERKQKSYFTILNI